jgi:hypothetical protein
MLTPRMIWDFHADEAKRMQFFTGIDTIYQGEAIPEHDLLIMPDVPQLYKIQDKSKVIVYPCVKDLSTFKILGYERYFTKDKAQSKQVDNSVILPPVVDYIGYNKRPIREMVSLVHYYEKRDPKNYKRTIEAGATLFGHENNPTWEDMEEIKNSKFVLHIKEVGYLCNVTLKAMCLTTPVIFSPESFEYGYQDYFRDGYNCIVTDDIEKALAISDSDYNALRIGLHTTIREIQSTYTETKRKANEIL